MKIKTTQYGYSDDPCMDSLTQDGIGAWDNTLNKDACALTKTAVSLLRANPYDWVILKFPNGLNLKRQYQDKAPENEPRVDLYMPEGFDPKIPDYADVEKA